MTLIRTMETPAGDKGYLQVQVVNIENNFPIQGARVSISYKGDPGRPLEEVMTNSSGQTENVSLNAPPKSYSLALGLEQPYSEYNLMVTASGFEPLEISGTEILSGTTALQPVRLQPEGEGLQREQPVVIPDHTLYGYYPPKIAEDEIKPVNESGEIVLSLSLIHI